MRLIINGYEIELNASTDIARTLQVNDIVNLSNRQSNFTNTFKIPKTAKNIKAFGKLTIQGVNSNAPYQRNGTYLYSDSGECLVYNGWSVITSTDDNFNINVYDGNIDLYKAIENTTLSELDLSDVNHFKTIDSVVGSWEETSPYRYIIADYNGKALIDNDPQRINIDYLVPSINVKWLWDKIFETYNFTYTGSVFNTFNFQNLWMTFPKGIADENPTPTNYYNNNSFTIIPDGSSLALEITHDLPSPTEGSFIDLDTAYLIPNDGTYVFNQNLVMSIALENPSGDIVPASGYTIYLSVNGGLTTFTLETAIDTYLFLNAGDIVKFYVQAFGGGINIFSADATGTIDIGFLAGQQIDFNETFIDFKTLDFIKEILNRFGLTPFKDKYSNNYNFLTLQELLQNNDIVDWSADKNKFVSKNKESYIIGSYAQKNDLIYKYNDAESDYYNGSISINNVNLQDNTTIISSQIYAPEKDISSVFEKQTNVYKLWNKEVKDNGDVTYKSLDKRFYFMRSEDYLFENVTSIESEALADSQVILSAPFESFFKLKFDDIIADYYLNIFQILKKSRIETNNIYLKENDIINIDFSKLYWIKELGSYYILNKINNFRGNSITSCEMIKVDYVANNEGIDYPITINSFIDGCLSFTSDLEYAVLNIQRSTDFGVTWLSQTGSSVSPRCGFTVSVTTYFRIINPLTNEVLSNIYVVSI